MTDEELYALVKRAKASLMHREQYSTMEIYPSFLTEMIAAITTLRAQLAEARADIAKMGRALNVARYGQPDFSWELHKMAMREAVEQRDRAEAALAAQIEAAASVVAQTNVPYEWTSEGAMQRRALRFAADVLRAQTPDRTTLDRMLRAEREKALREAALKATSFLVGDPLNGVPLRNPMAHEVADAILAMIEQEDN